MAQGRIPSPTCSLTNNQFLSGESIQRTNLRGIHQLGEKRRCRRGHLLRRVSRNDVSFIGAGTARSQGLLCLQDLRYVMPGRQIPFDKETKIIAISISL